MLSIFLAVGNAGIGLEFAAHSGDKRTWEARLELLCPGERSNLAGDNGSEPALTVRQPIRLFPRE